MSNQPMLANNQYDYNDYQSVQPIQNPAAGPSQFNPYTQPGPYDQAPPYQQPIQQQSLVENAQQQNYVPPVYSGNTDYSYDTYHINYNDNVDINGFNNQPNDPSPYAELWNGQQAFTQEKFAENSKKETRCNDVAFTILFLINFVATFVLLGYLVVKGKEYTSGSSSDPSYVTDPDLNSKMLTKAIGYSIALAIAINIVHFCYASFASVIYVKFGLFIGVVFAALMCLFPAISYGIWASLVFPVIMFFFSLIFYCIARPYIEFSAAVMKKCTQLICRYPSILLLVVLQSIIDIAISVMFAVIIYYVEVCQISAAVYIYVILSYFWITITTGYVVYMTGAGLAASWYFLNGTEYFPKSPVWQSFKRACTTSFGSAAYAGLILAVIQTLKTLVNMSGNSDNTLLNVLRCIAMCILNILEACVRWITRYALIYCAIYGVPFKEGCRRWAELSCKRFCDVLIEGCVISQVLTYNFFVFVIGAALIGLGVGYLAFPDNDTAKIFVPCFTAIFMCCIFLIYSQSIEVMADTIFVCFAESPDNLKTTANELYESMSQTYHQNLKRKTGR